MWRVRMTSPRGTEIAAACVVIAAVVFGCAAPAKPSATAVGVASPSVETTAPPSAPAATETPPPSPSPTVTLNPSPKELCATGDGEFPPETCKLDAGTYTSAPFKVPFQFTIDDGWTNYLAGINGGQLQMADTTNTGFGWATGMTAEGNRDVGQSTSALLAYIAAVPGINCIPAGQGDDRRCAGQLNRLQACPRARSSSLVARAEPGIRLARRFELTFSTRTVPLFCWPSRSTARTTSTRR